MIERRANRAERAAASEISGREHGAHLEIQRLDRALAAAHRRIAELEHTITNGGSICTQT